MFMDRRVNRHLLDEWIESHGPDGISRLAIESNVSSSLIQKVRAKKEPPKKLLTMQRLSSALGVDVDVLFPLVKVKAS